MDVKLIAAVGRSGQLGLAGGLPWGDRFPEDRRAFRDRTKGGIIIVGHNTWASVRALDGTWDRAVLCDHSAISPQEFLKLYRIEDDQTVWIAGGAKTYLRWLPLITEKDITVLDFNGPADVYMPIEIWQPELAYYAA